MDDCIDINELVIKDAIYDYQYSMDDNDWDNIQVLTDNKFVFDRGNFLYRNSKFICMDDNWKQKRLSNRDLNTYKYNKLLKAIKDSFEFSDNTLQLIKNTYIIWLRTFDYAYIKTLFTTIINAKLIEGNDLTTAEQLVLDNSIKYQELDDDALGRSLSAEGYAVVDTAEKEIYKAITNLVFEDSNYLGVYLLFLNYFKDSMVNFVGSQKTQKEIKEYRDLLLKSTLGIEDKDKLNTKAVKMVDDKILTWWD